MTQLIDTEFEAGWSVNQRAISAYATYWQPASRVRVDESRVPLYRRVVRVFISHAHDDDAEFHRVSEIVAAAGAEPLAFNKGSIRGGRDFVSAVEKGLTDADVVVVVWSRSARDSSWVEQERNAAVALKNGRRPDLLILFVALDDTPLPALASNQLSIDLRSPTAAREIGLAISGDSIATSSSVRRAPPPLAVQRELTEPVRRKLIRALFQETASYFQEGLRNVEREHGAETDFDQPDAKTFACVAQLGGRRATCKIWMGAVFGNGDTLLYAEDRTFGNSINDSIDVGPGVDPTSPTFDAMMPMHSAKKSKEMTLDETLQYLWERFIWRLSA